MSPYLWFNTEDQMSPADLVSHMYNIFLSFKGHTMANQKPSFPPF